MSYSCLRHQYYSPKEPCGTCTRERDMQMMGQMQSSNQQALMRAQMQAQRWPQDVFERLEGERDVAVKLAATYCVALDQIAAVLAMGLSYEEAVTRIAAIVADAPRGPSPSLRTEGDGK